MGREAGSGTKTLPAASIAPHAENLWLREHRLGAAKGVTDAEAGRAGLLMCISNRRRGAPQVALHDAG